MTVFPSQVKTRAKKILPSQPKTKVSEIQAVNLPPKFTVPKYVRVRFLYKNVAIDAEYTPSEIRLP